MSAPDHIAKPDYWKMGIPHGEMKERGSTAIR
jgi:hypothetical protein